MRRFTSSPQFDGYSKVVVIVSDEIEYTAGNDMGRTMRLTCPWGTPEMAQNILESVRGFQYQPYTAEGAILDPSVELGDGVIANNIYGGVYTSKLKFGSLLTATVAAPEDEEINHEYPYKSKPNKEVTREAKLLRAEMRIQADRISMEITDRQNDVKTLTSQLQLQSGLIEAKVSKTGGDASSFGWALDASSWKLQANNKDVLLATKNGLEVYGKITATSGKIGGFNIQPNYMSYNNQTWGGTNSTGIYLGPSGFQLGKKFKVDSDGNLNASSGKFTGTVYAGSIQYGNTGGYLSGSGIASDSITGDRMEAGTITTRYTSDGINSGVAGGVLAKDVFAGNDTASYIKTKALLVGSTQFTKQTFSFKDYYGNTRTITCLAEAS